MGVLVVWRGGEADSLVTVRELHSEEGHQGVQVVIPLEEETELAGERDVFLLDSLDVNFLDQTVVGHNTFVVHAVHEGLRDGDLPDTGHVKSVDIVYVTANLPRS